MGLEHRVGGHMAGEKAGEARCTPEARYTPEKDSVSCSHSERARAAGGKL